MRSQLDYYRYMGFNTDELKLRYAPYADRFLAGSRVLDLGCGRGEFLELLSARGVRGIGVDADEEMIGEVRRKGLQATLADGVAHLQAHAEEYDGIFAAHLIEHLPPEGVECLVEAAANALTSGGRLILVTPNPQNLQMQLHDFWIDLQHVRFYSPDILRWLLHRAGLREIETGENSRYRSGPAVAHAAIPRGPGPGQDPPSVTMRIRRKLLRAINRTPTRRRIAELERRTNAVTEWMHGLYPPAEYFATGLR